jgi:DNA-binding LytR/AlgR family response regulator
MINCVIIEDEPLAQSGLLKLTKLIDNLNVLAICDNIHDFLKFEALNKHKSIDLLFLDIELPGTSGINFLRQKNFTIPVILTTAYSQYAIEGYALNVLDYLLKPIAKERFKQSIIKVENYIRFINTKDQAHDFIYIKSEKIIEKVYFKEILIVEALRNYVVYYCENRKLICHNTLKNVEQNLPNDLFIKIQKSFIINKKKIQKIEKGYVFIDNKRIAMNRENRMEIIKCLTED